MKNVSVDKKSLSAKDPLLFEGFLGKGISGIKFVNRIRRSARERKYIEKLRNRHKK